jgi:membrane protein DedA with SNARE-associated domain
MSATRSTDDDAAAAGVGDTWRRIGLTVVVARFAIPLAAIPFIPYLIINDISLLVLLRPQKEFLLVGGGQSRYLGEPGVLPLFLAYLPLGILSVAAFFLVGRAYRTALQDGAGPAWLSKAIPPKQLDLALKVLKRRGPAIAILGRIAAMPATVLGAAAGLSDVDARRYLLADLTGALLSFGITVGAGFALGRAYQEGGVWLTVAGVTLFVMMLVLLTSWIRREAAREDARENAENARENGEPAA